MGFSVSASTAIIFAGLFLATGILYPAMDNGMERINDAQVDRDQAQLDLRNTVIEIQSTDNGDIRVTNNGSTSLTVSEVDLLIEGVYQERANDGNGDFTAEIDGSEDSNLWLPGDTLVIDSNANNGDQVRIVTEHGISVTTEV